MAFSQWKKNSTALDLKAKVTSSAKEDGANPEQLVANAAGNNDATILQAIHSLREDLLKKIDDNANTQSKELRREISQLRDELKSVVD